MLRTAAFDSKVDQRLLPEARALYRICRQPMSVAELATKLQLTLGVVRVLADDLSREGLVEVLRDASGGPTLDLLRKVRDGLAKLPR